MVPASPTPVAGPVVSAAPSVAHVDPNSTIFQSRSIYFDFDKSVIKAEFQKTLEVHGQYLAKNPTVVIKIEGNTDQKGSAKYNLTLGKRRADAVAKVLKLNGARAAQMGVISFGKVKPKVLGSDDSAMAQNRRVDLSYPAK
jgi:peptidoglycan-associated lipoprotein